MKDSDQCHSSGSIVQLANNRRTSTCRTENKSSLEMTLNSLCLNRRLEDTQHRLQCHQRCSTRTGYAVLFCAYTWYVINTLDLFSRKNYIGFLNFTFSVQTTIMFMPFPMLSLAFLRTICYFTTCATNLNLLEGEITLHTAFGFISMITQGWFF